MECPCRDCPNRTIGCVCEEYKKWKEERNKINRKIATQNMMNGWQVPEKGRRR